jgi:extracellular factor (EF) 3-hydroxypalmitic acid methyl ester biosynthesis protein
MNAVPDTASHHAGRIDPDFESHVDAMVECLESWRPESDRRAFHERLDSLLERARPSCTLTAPRAAEWRRRVHPYFMQAPWIDRAFRKPLGYAGDFELMNIIYRNEPEGVTPLGRALHQWANLFRSASAVRSRRRWILQAMQDHAQKHTGPYRILSLASGPAMELQDLVRESFLAERAELLCIDQDAQSLGYAETAIRQAMVETGRHLPAAFSRDSVKNLLARGSREDSGSRDFAYAMGLYDYLPESVARRLTSMLYGLLAPGGRLVIGNFAGHADAREFLELVCDWHLVYRSADEMHALASELPRDAKVDVRLDSTGTVYFLSVERP